MKNLLISISVALVLCVSSKASADRTVTVIKDAVKVTIHSDRDAAKWTKAFTFDVPTTVVIKPCPYRPNVKDSDCLYEVGPRGKERKLWSYTNHELTYPTWETSYKIASR